MEPTSVASITDATLTTDHHDQEYQTIRDLVARCLDEVKGPLFTTTATKLGEAWIGRIPEPHRRHYTCDACRRFLDTYGGLVTHDPIKGPQPILNLADVPEFFQPAFAALVSRVYGAKIDGVFFSPAQVWGQPITNEWSHLSVPAVPDRFVFKAKPQLNAFQAMAEKREDFKMLAGYRTDDGPHVAGALKDYPASAATEALRVLESDALFRSEVVIGPAKWFDGVHKSIAGKSGTERANAIWAAVATAPAGFAHINTTMISTLLDDIIAGLPFADIARRFATKMDPLKHRRPTAAPSDGQVEAAEKLIASMGAAGSFRRRFATLADILEWVWQPIPDAPQVPPAAGQVFGHLKGGAAKVAPIELPVVTMTWERFVKDRLPAVRKL